MFMSVPVQSCPLDKTCCFFVLNDKNRLIFLNVFA